MATPGLTMSADNMEPIMEAHTLVTQLYDPANQRNPTTINDIQLRIQQLQKGPNGWEIADALLRNPSTHHRFMGALTFTVKINVTGNQIDEETTWTIVERLINHTVRLVNEGEQAMVIRKLASSLVAIFKSVNTSWEHALWQLAASLSHGAYVNQHDCQRVDFFGGLLPTLSIPKATALVFFSIALAEEALRLYPEPQDSVRSAIRRALSNVNHALWLVKYILEKITDHSVREAIAPGEIALANEAMGSWKTWLGVFANYRHDDLPDTQSLAVICGYHIIDSLRMPSLMEGAASILTSALENRSWVFDNHSILSMAKTLSNSIVSKSILSYCGEDSDTDGMVFVDLLVEYVRHVSFDLFTDPMQPHHSDVLVILQNVFKIPGYAAVEESATTRVLEYWGDIAEYLPDKLEVSDPRYQIVKAQMAEVVLNLFKKLLYPTSSELADWSDFEINEFNAYRHEACDYLLSAYPILGVELVNVFQESATNHLRNFDWQGFEAAMFCLARLSEAVDENGHADQCLDSIFGSQAFVELCLAREKVGITPRARQTLVDAFGKYQSYFERRSHLLPGILDILFESLRFDSSATLASRSILALSKSCSRMLTGELPAFLDQLGRFRTEATATVHTMPKVLEGIATIIQKLDSWEEQVQTLERILGYFVEEAHSARAEAAANELDTAIDHAWLVLSSIASIGKGLRSDGDDVVNLDGAQDESPYPQSVWNTGSGARVQQFIMEAMRLLIVDFPVNNLIIEPACEILKAGYTESTGLFVFPPSVTVDFIKSFPLGISGTDVIMATASSFLASHASHAMQIRDEAAQLIAHVSQLFASMFDNADVYDPETANAGIDFLTRLLPRYYTILFSLTEPLPTPTVPESQGTPIFALILNFTIQALARSEPLVLRSASAFWVRLIDLRGESAEETAALDQVLDHFVPPLCDTAMAQIQGRCARSDLTFLSDVLRRIAFKKMQVARASMTASLSVIDEQVLPEQEKSRFISSIIVARGAKAPTSELVRGLWLKCRGSSFDYVH